jgi:cytochrome c oxidase subunit 1
MQPSPNGNLMIFYGLIYTGLSSTLTAFNFILTIYSWKSIGLSMSSMEVFNWSQLVIVDLLVLVLPVLASSLGMLVGDLIYNTVYFDEMYGGDSVYFQHLFWFFGHPEVYVLILPGFGITSSTLSSICQ